MKKHLSVIVATYNRRIALAELLECLLRQTYANFEIIVINDAGESIEDVCLLYPELTIKLINLPYNQGSATARNTGILQASSDLILFCDDDDLLHSSHIEQMLSNLNQDDFLYADAEIFHYHYTKYYRVPTNISTFAFLYQPEMMRVCSTFIPSGCLYRKEIHHKTGMLDSNVPIYWDWDFILRTMERGFKIKRIPTASVYYAFNAQHSHLSSNLEKMQKELCVLSEKHHLGNLSVKNFSLLLTDPTIAHLRAQTQKLWDQQPIISRINQL